jgi:hypothetical protein
MSTNSAVTTYTANHSSYSGCDIVASITIPGISSKSYVIGELQTVSYSIHREVQPVRTLGRINPKGFTSGTRTIAGSLIFTVFDSNLVHKIVNIIRGSYLLKDGENRARYSNDAVIKEWITTRNYSVMDEMPPFDITITFMNEYGGDHSTLIIKGVVIVDEGQVMSVEDMITENTMSYMATDIQVLKDDSYKLSGESKASVGNASVQAMGTSAAAAVTLQSSMPTSYDDILKLTTDTALKSITVASGNLYPAFTPSITEYTLNIPTGTTEPPAITASAQNSDATVVVTPSSSVSGKTKIAVSSPGSPTTYYYITNKVVEKDAALKNITINGIPLDNFSPIVYNYGIEVLPGQGIPIVKGYTNSSDAIVSVSRPFSVPGVAVITVIADDRTTIKRYSIAMTMKANLSSNADLANVATSNSLLTTVFDKTNTTYTVVVPLGSKIIPILTAVAEDRTSAKLTITQPTSLTGGGAVGTIKVTAADNVTTKIYTFNVVSNDYKYFGEVFNVGTVKTGDEVSFTCKIVNVIDGVGAVAADSQFDLQIPGHYVFLEYHDGRNYLVSQEVTVSGIYKGTTQTYNDNPCYTVTLY